MEKWAKGAYSRQSMEQLALINSEQLGRTLMLNDLCELADDAVSEFYRQTPKEDHEREQLGP
jgi:hypothetical protein